MLRWIASTVMRDLMKLLGSVLGTLLPRPVAWVCHCC